MYLIMYICLCLCMCVNKYIVEKIDVCLNKCISLRFISAFCDTLLVRYIFTNNMTHMKICLILYFNTLIVVQIDSTLFLIAKNVQIFRD